MCQRSRMRLIREREVDQHNPGLRKEQDKLLGGLVAAMRGLRQIGFSEAEMMAVREMAAPYLRSVEHILTGEPSVE